MWGAIAQAGAQNMDTAASLGIGINNYNLQKENLAYQKQAQLISWQREDSSVQRRAADLKAAGLSPVLAAGGGASTMAPIKTDAPQADPNMAKIALDFQQMELIQQQIGQTKAGTNLTEAKTRGINLDNKGIHPGKADGFTKFARQLKQFLKTDPDIGAGIKFLTEKSKPGTNKKGVLPQHYQGRPNWFKNHGKVIQDAILKNQKRRKTQ